MLLFDNEYFICFNGIQFFKILKIIKINDSTMIEIKFNFTYNIRTDNRRINDTPCIK